MIHKGRITISEIKRDWPHHVALPPEAVYGVVTSMQIYQYAKDLAGAPRPYRLHRGGGKLIVFCFSDHEAAKMFAERFGGELLPVAG
jgi:hypothetical protein